MWDQAYLMRHALCKTYANNDRMLNEALERD
jgi:hypothetical protein